jgi:hypothetical protein
MGFDEKMNLVLFGASEVHSKRHTVKQLGRIMLRGEHIAVIQSSPGPTSLKDLAAIKVSQSISEGKDLEQAELPKKVETFVRGYLDH